jgi:hypothetical protein
MTHSTVYLSHTTTLCFSMQMSSQLIFALNPWRLPITLSLCLPMFSSSFQCDDSDQKSHVFFLLQTEETPH